MKNPTDHSFTSKGYTATRSGLEGTVAETGKAPAKPAPRARDELPEYLRRYYAWAYLWPVSVRFFDQQPVINAILFGHYREIMGHTLRLMEAKDAGRTLQIAAVYGELTPTLAGEIDDLHVIDAASIQLNTLARKLAAGGRTAQLERMHAEALHYDSDAFDTALMFLLLHEMPPYARRGTLREALRVLRPGGRLVIAEYGELGKRHFLHRFPPARWILTTAEPFLKYFWTESLREVLDECAADVGKTIVLDEQVDIFGGFYRAMRFRVQS